jgi:hypothetical protein
MLILSGNAAFFIGLSHIATFAYIVSNLYSCFVLLVRISKPAPVVTQGFTSSMEQMIQRRIKENNFNDVLPVTFSKQGGGSLRDDHGNKEELPLHRIKFNIS